MAAKRKCKGKTKAGKRCRAAPLKNGDHCIAHAKAQGSDKVSQGFGGPQPGSGRPRTPRVTDLLRERAAGRADVIDAIYERAMTEPKIVAKYEGEVHVSDIDDLAAMLAAAERYLDRIEGKPRQGLDVHAEVEGSEGSPVVSIVPIDAADPEIRKLAHDLVKRLAGRPATRGAAPSSPSDTGRAGMARRRKSKPA